MGYTNPVLNKSWEAASDLSAKEGFAVKLNGSNKLALCGAGDKSVGILLNKPTSGQQGDVGVIGIQNAVTGAAYTEFDQLAADSAGKLVKCTPGAQAIAVALEAATGADQRKAVLMLAGLGAEPPYFSLTAGAEAANVIKVSAQLKNADDTNVAVATKYYAKSFDSDATFTDGGAGTIEAGSTTVEIAGTTDATGLAEINVTDVNAETVVVMVVPERGSPTFISLVFA